MDINGTTRVCGLIGNPVAHSISPVIHNRLAGLRGHRKDGKSALRFASGTGRKNIYRLLSGARFTRQCHLRTDAERPGHRRNQLRIN